MKRFKRLLIILVALVIIFPFNDVKAATSKKISLNKKSAITYVGKTVNLKVSKFTTKETKKKIVWKSSNRKIATVYKDGKVVAKKPGKVVITAMMKSNKKIYSKCKITIYNPTKTLKLNSEKTISLIVGDTENINVSAIEPVSGTQPIEYASTNKKIASVDSKGRIKALSVGNTSVKAVSGGKSVTVIVYVIDKGTSYSYNENVKNNLFIDQEYTTEVDSSGRILISIPNNSQMPKKGEYITLPSAHEDLVFRVADIINRPNGEIFLQIEVPNAISDVYSNLSIGETMFPSGVEVIPEEGVTIDAIETISGRALDNTSLLGASLDVSDTDSIRISGSFNIGENNKILYKCSFYPSQILFDTKQKIFKLYMPYTISFTSESTVIDVSNYKKELFKQVIFDYGTVLSVQASVGISVDASMEVKNGINFEGVLEIESIDHNVTNKSTISLKGVDYQFNVELKIGPYLKCDLYAFEEEIEFINSILEKAHFKKASNELAKSLYFIELDVYVKSSLNEVSQEDGTLCDSVYGDIGAEASGKSERIDWLPEFSKPIAEKRIINMHKENGKDVKYCNYTPFSLDHKAVTLKAGEIQKISVVENINDPEEMHWSVKDASIIQLYAKTGREISFKAKKAGTTVITCKIGSKTEKCSITVKKDSRQLFSTKPIKNGTYLANKEWTIYDENGKTTIFKSKSAEVKDGYLIIDGYVFAFRGEKTIVWKSQRRKLKLASNCKINYSGGEMFYPINSSEVKKGFKVRLEIVFDVDKKGYVTAIVVCS